VSEQSRLRLRLFPRAETAVAKGHPWVYGESIREQNRPGEPGELAVIYDRRDRFLALGFFDPQSPIQVRILQLRKPVQAGLDLWRERIRTAIALRVETDVFLLGPPVDVASMGRAMACPASSRIAMATPWS